VTNTLQHIEDLDFAEWAALTKRAAGAAVAAAQRLGTTPPVVLTAVAAMSEQDLIEHRNRFGPGRKRLSPVMRLVKADQLRVVAERQAGEAQQDKRDAEAAASMARAETEQFARAAMHARERARAVEAESARKDAERADQRAAAQHAVEEMRAQLEGVRAEAAAEAAAAREQLVAAQARAEQRTAERTADRAAAQQEVQELRAELERVRAAAAAAAAAAGERLSAAETRAEARSAERAAEREAAQHALEGVRAELERVRADAAAEVAAARGKAGGEVDAAHKAAAAEVSRARTEAGESLARLQDEMKRVQADAAAEVAAAREWADIAIAAGRQTAQAEIARVRAEAGSAHQAEAAPDASPQLLTIPIPPPGIRAHTGRIEDAVFMVREVDYLLEVSFADDVKSPSFGGAEPLRTLVATVQEQARELSQDLRDLPTRYSTQWQVDTAAGYASAAAKAYGALLQRIAVVTGELANRAEGADAEVIEFVTTMLDEHPWRRR
jgi:colicin import membrane protein